MAEEICTTGRRKAAVARVRITDGTGKITCNGLPFEEYFTFAALRGYICKPLAVAEKTDKVDVAATLTGGGKSGQAGALRLGLARAMVVMDEDLKPVMKKSGGLMTRDSREKERKKPGRPGARKRFQFSKR